MKFFPKTPEQLYIFILTILIIVGAGVLAYLGKIIINQLMEGNKILAKVEKKVILHESNIQKHEDEILLLRSEDKKREYTIFKLSERISLIEKTKDIKNSQ